MYPWIGYYDEWCLCHPWKQLTKLYKLYWTTKCVMHNLMLCYFPLKHWQTAATESHAHNRCQKVSACNNAVQLTLMNTDSLMIYSGSVFREWHFISQKCTFSPKTLHGLLWVQVRRVSVGQVVSWSCRCCVWEVISCLARPALWPNSPNLEIIIVGLPICTFTEMGQGCGHCSGGTKREDTEN